MRKNERISKKTRENKKSRNRTRKWGKRGKEPDRPAQLSDPGPIQQSVCRRVALRIRTEKFTCGERTEGIRGRRVGFGVSEGQTFLVPDFLPFFLSLFFRVFPLFLWSCCCCYSCCCSEHTYYDIYYFYICILCFIFFFSFASKFSLFSNITNIILITPSFPSTIIFENYAVPVFLHFIHFYLRKKENLNPSHLTSYPLPPAPPPPHEKAEIPTMKSLSNEHITPSNFQGSFTFISRPSVVYTYLVSSVCVLGSRLHTPALRDGGAPSLLKQEI